jgi:hypothetical protein
MVINVEVLDYTLTAVNTIGLMIGVENCLAREPFEKFVDWRQCATLM